MDPGGRNTTRFSSLAFDSAGQNRASSLVSMRMPAYSSAITLEGEGGMDSRRVSGSEPGANAGQVGADASSVSSNAMTLDAACVARNAFRPASIERPDFNWLRWGTRFVHRPSRTNVCWGLSWAIQSRSKADRLVVHLVRHERRHLAATSDGEATCNGADPVGVLRGATSIALLIPKVWGCCGRASTSPSSPEGVARGEDHFRVAATGIDIGIPSN